MIFVVPKQNLCFDPSRCFTFTNIFGLRPETKFWVIRGWVLLQTGPIGDDVNTLADMFDCLDLAPIRWERLGRLAYHLLDGILMLKSPTLPKHLLKNNIGRLQCLHLDYSRRMPSGWYFISIFVAFVRFVDHLVEYRLSLRRLLFNDDVLYFDSIIMVCRLFHVIWMRDFRSNATTLEPIKVLDLHFKRPKVLLAHVKNVFADAFCILKRWHLLVLIKRRPINHDWF